MIWRKTSPLAAQLLQLSDLVGRSADALREQHKLESSSRARSKPHSRVKYSLKSRASRATCAMMAPRLCGSLTRHAAGRRTAAVCNGRGAKVVSRLWSAAIALEAHKPSSFQAFDHRVVCTPGLTVWAHYDELSRAV